MCLKLLARPWLFTFCSQEGAPMELHGSYEDLKACPLQLSNFIRHQEYLIRHLPELNSQRWLLYVRAFLHLTLSD